MPHDVFISYSNWDKKYADAACHYIEQEGIRCFIAPRDIHPGADWATAINAGITEAKIFVLILTPNSNASEQVFREVNLAVKNRLEIITFKVEEVKLEKGLEYYISVSHWLDALTKPLEKHLKTLADTIKERCPQEKSPTPTDGDMNGKGTKVKDPSVRRKKRRRLIWLAVVLPLATIVIASIIYELIYDFNIWYQQEYHKLIEQYDTQLVTPQNATVGSAEGEQKGYIPFINPVFILSKNVQVDDNFISGDLSIFADPQTNGSVLIRSTKDLSILRTIETPLTYDALRPENSKEDSDGVNTIFSDDHQWLVIYSFYYAHLFNLEDTTVDQALPVEGILQGVRFLDGAEKIGLWYTVADGDYPVMYPPIDTSNRALVLNRQNNQIQFDMVFKTPIQFLGFTRDGSYAVGEQGEDYITAVNMQNGEVLHNDDALSVCNEKVDFLPFSKEGKYVSLYQEQLQIAARGLDGQKKITIKRCADGVNVLNLEFTEECSSEFLENELLMVYHDDIQSIYELNHGKEIFKISPSGSDFFAPFGFIPGTNMLFVLTDPNDDFDLRVALYDTDTGEILYANVPFELSTSSNSIITKDKAVFFYNDGHGSLSCQLVRYQVTDDGKVEFED